MPEGGGIQAPDTSPERERLCRRIVWRDAACGIRSPGLRQGAFMGSVSDGIGRTIDATLVRARIMCEPYEFGGTAVRVQVAAAAERSSRARQTGAPASRVRRSKWVW